MLNGLNFGNEEILRTGVQPEDRDTCTAVFLYIFI